MFDYIVAFSRFFRKIGNEVFWVSLGCFVYGNVLLLTHPELEETLHNWNFSMLCLACFSVWCSPIGKFLSKELNEPSKEVENGK